MGWYRYSVVPDGDGGFAIIDEDCDRRLVDEHGRVYEDEAAGYHRYPTESKAEEAIERWRRAEDDRRAHLAMGRMLRERAEKSPPDPVVRALISVMFPSSEE